MSMITIVQLSFTTWDDTQWTIQKLQHYCASMINLRLITRNQTMLYHRVSEAKIHSTSFNCVRCSWSRCQHKRIFYIIIFSRSWNYWSVWQFLSRASHSSFKKPCPATKFTVSSCYRNKRATARPCETCFNYIFWRWTRPSSNLSFCTTIPYINFCWFGSGYVNFSSNCSWTQLGESIRAADVSFKSCLSEHLREFCSADMEKKVQEVHRNGGYSKIICKWQKKFLKSGSKFFNQWRKF